MKSNRSLLTIAACVAALASISTAEAGKSRSPSPPKKPTPSSGSHLGVPADKQPKLGRSSYAKNPSSSASLSQRNFEAAAKKNARRNKGETLPHPSPKPGVLVTYGQSSTPAPGGAAPIAVPPITPRRDSISSTRAQYPRRLSTDTIRSYSSSSLSSGSALSAQSLRTVSVLLDRAPGDTAAGARALMQFHGIAEVRVAGGRK